MRCTRLLRNKRVIGYSPILAEIAVATVNLHCIVADNEAGVGGEAFDESAGIRGRGTELGSSTPHHDEPNATAALRTLKLSIFRRLRRNCGVFSPLQAHLPHGRHQLLLLQPQVR